jgi:hypothetical protein
MESWTGGKGGVQGKVGVSREWVKPAWVWQIGSLPARSGLRSTEHGATERNTYSVLLSLWDLSFCGCSFTTTEIQLAGWGQRPRATRIFSDRTSHDSVERQPAHHCQK